MSGHGYSGKEVIKQCWAILRRGNGKPLEAWKFRNNLDYY
jgi:hypothetical protein